MKKFFAFCSVRFMEWWIHAHLHFFYMSRQCSLLFGCAVFSSSIDFCSCTVRCVHHCKSWVAIIHLITFTRLLYTLEMFQTIEVIKSFVIIITWQTSMLHVFSVLMLLSFLHDLIVCWSDQHHCYNILARTFNRILSLLSQYANHFTMLININTHNKPKFRRCRIFFSLYFWLFFCANTSWMLFTLPLAKNRSDRYNWFEIKSKQQ